MNRVTRNESGFRGYFLEAALRLKVDIRLDVLFNSCLYNLSLENCSSQSNEQITNNYTRKTRESIALTAVRDN